MTGFAILSKGLLRTDRLAVNHIHTRPDSEHAPKVLLLGGSNFDLRLKSGFLKTALPKACEIVTYEPRGIGLTVQPPGEWSMQDFALDAISVLDAVGWDKASIIGESFGGMTGFHVAIMAPERVLTLVTSSATAGGAGARSYDISEFLGLSREEAAIRALCLQDCRNVALRKNDPDRFAELLRSRLAFEDAFVDPSISSGGYGRLLEARREHDCAEAALGITAHTMLIAGIYDRQSNPDAQRVLANTLPNGRFLSFEAGHGVLFGLEEATQSAIDAVTSEAISVQG